MQWHRFLFQCSRYADFSISQQKKCIHCFCLPHYCFCHFNNSTFLSLSLSSIRVFSFQYFFCSRIVKHICRLSWTGCHSKLFIVCFFSVHQHEHSVVKRKWLSNVCTSIAQKAYFLLLQFTKVFFSIFGEEKKVQGNLYLLVKKEMDLFKAEKKIRWKVVQLSHFSWQTDTVRLDICTQCYASRTCSLMRTITLVFYHNNSFHSFSSFRFCSFAREDSILTNLFSTYSFDKQQQLQWKKNCCRLICIYL